MSVFSELKVKKIATEDYEFFAEKLRYCLERVNNYILDNDFNLVKWDFFVDASSEKDFAQKKRQILSEIANSAKLSKTVSPLIISQPPLIDKELVVEAWFIEKVNFKFEVKEKNNYRYGLLGEGEKKVVFCGCCEKDFLDSTSEDFISSATKSFEYIKDVLRTEGLCFNNVIRQWNYIGKILHLRKSEFGTVQNYQIFNDIRQAYYSNCQWQDGYPAATGIGMDFGGVAVGVVACHQSVMLSSFAIDNPLQVAAHDYSTQVLVGDATEKMTPKFERAKTIFSDGGSVIVFVSGTAAIRGEKSLGDDPKEQTLLTMENINYLISAKNIEKFTKKDVEFNNRAAWRVYVKNKAQLYDIRSSLQGFNLNDQEVIYVIADVCRSELLVEIECIGTAASHC